MALTELFDMLDAAPYGAYAMDLNRRILFWNRRAQDILGHEAEHVVGRQCYSVVFGLPDRASALYCTEECLTHRLTETRKTAPVARVRMLCAWGERKRVDILVLHVPGTVECSPMVVHLFYDRTEDPHRDIVSSGHRTASTSGAGRPGGGPLTPRELEVVELLAAGESAAEIAESLHLSLHTVRNHVRNAREKLDAHSGLSLVATAKRLGLL